MESCDRRNLSWSFYGLGGFRQLIRNGFDGVVSDLDRGLAERHIKAGATWAATPAELAGQVDHVFTCLPSPAISEKVLAEILTSLKRGGTWIENSTNGRDEMLRLAGLAKAKGIEVLEAPVTGGVHLAARGEITVLVGGDAVWSRYRQYPVFADIPEVLSTSGGKPGRKSNYSAVVEVIHLSTPSSLPCQSIKRFDTATGRIDKDLAVMSREYRLLQIVDPALTPSNAPPTMKRMLLVST